MSEEVEVQPEDRLKTAIQYVAGFIDLGIEVRITTNQCEVISNGITYVPDIRNVGEFIRSLEFVNSAIEED